MAAQFLKGMSFGAYTMAVIAIDRLYGSFWHIMVAAAVFLFVVRVIDSVSPDTDTGAE